MNKDEIKQVLNCNYYTFTNCAYCKEEIWRGYYAEGRIGKKLIFPQFMTRVFTNNITEIPIHFCCIRPFIMDMLREGGKDIYGGEISGDKGNTKVLIRN